MRYDSGTTHIQEAEHTHTHTHARTHTKTSTFSQTSFLFHLTVTLSASLYFSHCLVGSAAVVCLRVCVRVRERESVCVWVFG